MSCKPFKSKRFLALLTLFTLLCSLLPIGVFAAEVDGVTNIRFEVTQGAFGESIKLNFDKPADLTNIYGFTVQLLSNNGTIASQVVPVDKNQPLESYPEACQFVIPGQDIHYNTVKVTSVPEGGYTEKVVEVPISYATVHSGTSPTFTAVQQDDVYRITLNSNPIENAVYVIHYLSKQAGNTIFSLVRPASMFKGFTLNEKCEASYDVAIQVVYPYTTSGLTITTSSAAIVPTLVAKDNSVLTEKINQAKALHDAAVEGTEIGQYAVGSKATLLSAITLAEGEMNGMQSQIDFQLDSLNKALINFASKKVAPPTAVTNIRIEQNSIYRAPEVLFDLPADTTGISEFGVKFSIAGTWVNHYWSSQVNDTTRVSLDFVAGDFNETSTIDAIEVTSYSSDHHVLQSFTAPANFKITVEGSAPTFTLTTDPAQGYYLLSLAEDPIPGNIYLVKTPTTGHSFKAETITNRIIKIRASDAVNKNPSFHLRTLSQFTVNGLTISPKSTTATTTPISSGGSINPTPPPSLNDEVNEKPSRDTTSSVNTGTTATSTSNTSAVPPLSLPSDFAQANSGDNNLVYVNTTLNNVKTEAQAISTLDQMDNLVNQINVATKTNSQNTSTYVPVVTQLALGTESKISLVQDPQKQLNLLENLVTELSLFKAATSQPTPELDKSVQELIQKTATNFGTVKLAPTLTNEPIKLDMNQLNTVIAQQTEAIKKLNELQSTYFDNGVVKNITKEIKIITAPSATSNTLRVELASDQVNTLNNAKVEAFTISNRQAALKIPVHNFGSQQPVQLVLEKLASTQTAQINEPVIYYDIAMLVNAQRQHSFDRPITLSFDLNAFGLDNETSEALAIHRKNEVSGLWEPVGGIVDPESKQIFVIRDNLSQYTVMKSKKSLSSADQSWAKAEINALLNKGIIADSKAFNPTSAITRGEFAQWIAKAYGLKVSTKSLPFKDVAKNSDQYAAIAAVYEKGLLSGKNKTSFDPNGSMTQEELAAALGKLLVSFDNKSKSGKVKSKYLSQLKTSQVASWAEDDMALLMELGLNTTGKSGKSIVTNEFAAAAFMKFYRS